MNAKQVMQELDSLGTAQNRKTYGRHGVGGPVFGVSYANLGKLAKRIGVDQALAEELWRTGNHDARVLAAMVADPGQVSRAALERWLEDVDNYVLNDAVCALAARCRAAEQCMREWIAAKREFVGAAGWTLVGRLAEVDGAYSDDEAESLLTTIEETVHGSANRVKHSMNQALICIALRSAKMKRKAIAAARRIGVIDVDHGDTGCKTPEAVGYIEKAVAHRALVAARRKAARKKKARPRSAGR